MTPAAIKHPFSKAGWGGGGDIPWAHNGPTVRYCPGSPGRGAAPSAPTSRGNRGTEHLRRDPTAPHEFQDPPHLAGGGAHTDREGGGLAPPFPSPPDPAGASRSPLGNGAGLVPSPGVSVCPGPPYLPLTALLGPIVPAGRQHPAGTRGTGDPGDSPGTWGVRGPLGTQQDTGHWGPSGAHNGHGACGDPRHPAGMQEGPRGHIRNAGCRRSLGTQQGCGRNPWGHGVQGTTGCQRGHWADGTPRSRGRTGTLGCWEGQEVPVGPRGPCKDVWHPGGGVRGC